MRPTQHPEVASVGAGLSIAAALKGVPLVMPVRTTFYGAGEIGVKDPAGHVVTFAQYGAALPRVYLT
jgi:uncharacterized glyoxalase superfamily protein PhnB